MSERKHVRKRVASYIELAGTLGEAGETIAQLIEAHGADADLTLDTECSNCDREIEGVEGSVWVERFETDEEMRVRLERETRWKAENEKRDRETYERLKARFEVES